MGVSANAGAASSAATPSTANLRDFRDFMIGLLRRPVRRRPSNDSLPPLLLARSRFDLLGLVQEIPQGLTAKRPQAPAAPRHDPEALVLIGNRPFLEALRIDRAVPLQIIVLDLVDRRLGRVGVLGAEMLLHLALDDDLELGIIVLEPIRKADGEGTSRHQEGTARHQHGTNGQTPPPRAKTHHLPPRSSARLNAANYTSCR